MSAPINTGGPAFPLPLGSQDLPEPAYGGMSLRDWFAGQALAGMMASEVDGSTYNEDPAAERAYRFADAMLAEREKGGAK